MDLFQKKIWICLMGFSLLNLLNFNHAFASQTLKQSAKVKSINSNL